MDDASFNAQDNRFRYKKIEHQVLLAIKGEKHDIVDTGKFPGIEENVPIHTYYIVGIK